MDNRACVSWDLMNSFLIDAFVGYGVPREDAAICADVLLESDRRGIESHGMLLAADYKDADGKDCVEVLTAPWAKPGDPVILEGADPAFKKPDVIDIDTFCAVEIKTINKSVQIGGVNLVVDGKPITTEFTVNGDIH